MSRLRREMGTFVQEWLQSGLWAATPFVIALAVGTAGDAVVCRDYDIPLAVSSMGGITVLGFTLALMSNTTND